MPRCNDCGSSRSVGTVEREGGIVLSLMLTVSFDTSVHNCARLGYCAHRKKCRSSNKDARCKSSLQTCEYKFEKGVNEPHQNSEKCVLWDSDVEIRV